MKSFLNRFQFSDSSNHIIWISGFIFLAMITRFALPPFMGHPENFSPIDASALFAGAYLGRKWLAFLVPILSVWISDLVIDHTYFHKWVLFYPGFYWQYGFYLAIVLFASFFLENRKGLRIPVAILLTSIAFFIVSNFGFLASSTFYPHTLTGLIVCYMAGLPFFKSTLLSDVAYSAILFIGFEWVRQKQWSKITPSRIQ